MLRQYRQTMCVRGMFFFFQAEDGIRDYKVTGVQTCALPISHARRARRRGSVERLRGARRGPVRRYIARQRWSEDRKSTRLNSSHLVISYAVFCLKKKKNTSTNQRTIMLQVDTAVRHTDSRGN